MNTKTLSNKTFFILLAILVLVVGVNALLPQAPIPGVTMPAASMPVWQMALAGMGVTAVLYGLLGFLGLILWRKLSFPDIWDESVTNRQRFLVPALAGVGMGVFIIIADLLFSPVNGIGRLMHPQFPTSLLAAVSAGIGEEIIFRLFFISFWTWLIGKVILRGRGLPIVYWVVASFSAVAFSAGHLPSLMFLLNVTDPSKMSPVLLGEILLLNGTLSMVGAFLFKKYGFLATVGVHFWADVIWHVLWGLI
jgi:hypothetical protein